MVTKEDMEQYHKMLDGKVVIMGTIEKTIEINEKYIAFLQHRIKETKELIESIKNFCREIKIKFEIKKFYWV